ncbi:hypothetical protein GOODEAATRI_016831 [Goodea atripinnis]|uniref:Transposase n=1 Tax=Goodea atripinnis TaxID=208336 RepID=A0ABV0NNB4_9TELE
MGASVELEEGMEPAVREVIREVTAKPTKVIKDKLGPVSLLLQAQRRQLEDHGARIKEVEARHSAMEDGMTWLPELLNIKTKMRRLKMERVHRTTSQVPSSGQRSSPALVRLHNFQDKQRIMKAAWEMSRNNLPLKYENATVMIFQDFSAAVVWKSYDEVRKRLCAIGTDHIIDLPHSAERVG